MDDLLESVSQPEQPDAERPGGGGAGRGRRVASTPGNPFDDSDEEQDGGQAELEEVVVQTSEHTNKAGSLEQFYVDVGRINTALADVRRSLTKLSSQFEESTTSTRSENTKDLRGAPRRCRSPRPVPASAKRRGR